MIYTSKASAISKGPKKLSISRANPPPPLPQVMDLPASDNITRGDI
jgi:hypothetical protein